VGRVLIIEREELPEGKEAARAPGGIALRGSSAWPGGTTRRLGALEVGRTLGGVESNVPVPLEDQLCEECQNSVVTVILASGQALCTACAAIRFRIPTTDRAKLRAAIEAGRSAGAHWPRNS
jgi:hypothetical protein